MVKRVLILMAGVCMLMPQAFGVAILSLDGSSLNGTIEVDGSWKSVNGAIVRTAVQKANYTHALVIPNALDLTQVTFPVTLTYDLMIETEGAGKGEVWTGIGLCTPPAGASNIEDGAIIVALRDNSGSKGVNFLVGGRQWAQGDKNYEWKAGQWYTIQVVLSNPDFKANKVDISAAVAQKGAAVAGVVITGKGIPVSGNAFVLNQKNIALFTRGSAEGIGGMRSFDNIVVEAVNVNGGKVVFSNDGSSVAGMDVDSGTWESVGGAIVQTGKQVGDKTHALVKSGVINLTGGAEAVSLEYDVKVQSLTTKGDETWTGIGLFTPVKGASNIEDGAVIMTIRDGGNATAATPNARGLHALLGGRAWLYNSVSNLLFKADTWYHMSVTVSKISPTTGKADIVATLAEVGGSGAASVVLKNAPASNKFEFGQKGIALFTRSGGSAEGGQRSFKNIVLTQIPNLAASEVENFESLK